MVSIQGDHLSGLHLMGGKPLLLGVFVLRLFDHSETFPYHIFTGYCVPPTPTKQAVRAWGRAYRAFLLCAFLS